MKTLIAPSILASDFAHLGSEVAMINESQAGWIHIDVMDGVFVPNISLGIPVVQAIKKQAKKPLDVHLMITNPGRYIADFHRAGASIISVHIEADPHLHRTVQQIKGLHCKAGVALNPHTPVAHLESIIEEIDFVCIMAVNPGFGGQQFIEHTYEKVNTLKKMIDRKNVKVRIEVDGGVNERNAARLVAAGADILVAGNSVFSSENPKKTIEELAVNYPKSPSNSL